MSTEEPAPDYRVAPPGLGYVPEGYLPPEPAPNRISRRRVWLALGLAAVVVVSAGTTAGYLVFGRWDGRPATGDVAITVRVSSPAGDRPSTSALEQTKQILQDRMVESDLTRPTVTAIGDETLLVTAASEQSDQVEALLAPGSLSFRRVLATRLEEPPVTDTECTDDPPGRLDPVAVAASAKDKLGTAFDLPGEESEPVRLDDPAVAAYTGLTCAEVAALPPELQYRVPAITCPTLERRPAGVFDRLDASTAACDSEQATRYLLDVAKVVGADLASAEAELHQSTGDWVIQLRFTETGQPKWTALTEETVAAGKPGGEDQQIAIVLDNTVLSAPNVPYVVRGDATLSGAFGADTARTLAATLAHGVLPARLTVVAVETVR
ncbi:hypothetical protein O7632_19810 [Solwaraspora sp. WMMD406]|uniref:SecDF P1 head subdomain-containing protein n=1 Tax=Solwaraspora sp. WMMD406 TaxID=3016095 RepID=UPI002417AF83|nr:hypothetical protein [Solwaraspora sp. WMMD406]MDG4766333.1 hypothetical protein [Solwaraspora sp. WMMD406]